MAGLAAAVALGNAPAASAATVDATGHHTAVATASTATASTATVLQAGVSAQLLVSVSGQPATGPVVRLDADTVAALTPKGKHHRTASAKYVVKDGDSLASIAQRLYHSSNYWTVLYWANHREIKYANEIQAGQVLTVPAKPAKIPSAPASLAPAAPAPAPSAPTTSTVSYSSASTASTAAPAQTPSSYSGDSGSLQACIIAAESGGDAQIWNASGHYGLYQFSESTWVEYGGDPAEFGDATVAEQNQVYDNAIAAGGASNWTLYDGC